MEEVKTKKNVKSTDNQIKNRPWLWQKGQSGNIAGRPKGKTMKEYAKELLACQTEEERREFLYGLPKDIVWKMAEGNPQTDITSGGEVIKPQPIINVFTNHSDNQDNPDVKASEDSAGRNVRVKDNIDSNILDSVKPIRPEANVDVDSSRIVSAPEERSREGLPEHHEGTPVLSGQEVGQK